ncbi:MAG: hypothetical protein MUC38_10195 [Cyclobacteriaceae bacterium]|jgi:hypothetical protein|nr:hypothetical protein [Cyclobacteriaceae bacterium]
MNIRLFLTAAALTLGSFAVAQEVGSMPSRTWAKISPQHFVINTFQLGVEHFTPDFSGSWNFSGGFRSQGGSGTYDTEIQGGELDIQYRKYVRPMKVYTGRKNRNYVQGVYVGPFVNGGAYAVDDQYSSTWISVDQNGRQVIQSQTYGSVYDTRHVAGGLTIGVQRTFWEVLALDVFVGGGVRFSHVEMRATTPNWSYYTGVLDPGFSGIFPRIGIKLGISL